MRVLLGLAAVLAVVAFVVVVAVNRTGVPQRDYIAEYAALRSGGISLDPASVADWRAFRSFDRHREAERMAGVALQAAIDRAAAEGIETASVDPTELLQFVYNEFARRGTAPDAGGPLENRILSEARAVAYAEVIALNRRPEIVEAQRRFNAHGLIAMDVPDTRWLEERSSDVITQHSPIRRSAMYEAIIMAVTDDADEFERAFALTLAAARAAASEPFVMSHLVVLAIEQLAASKLFDAIDDPGAPLPDPRRLLALVDRHESARPDIAWFFQGERLLVLDVIEAEFTKRPGFQSQHAFVTIPVVGVTHGQIYRMANAFFDHVDEAVTVRYAERGEAAAWLDRFIQRSDFRARPMLEQLVPATSMVIFIDDQYRAQRAGLRTALAIAAYRNDHAGTPARRA